MIKSRLLGIFISFSILFVVTSTNAATWTTIDGRVLTQTGAPVCAMVLANGQHAFSCGGGGNHSLNVPLDNNGLITVQVFAAGFAPFKRTLTTGQAIGYNTYMGRDTSGRAFTITHNEFPSSRPGWVFISGKINHNGTPLCAMILVNGQSMFSCNDTLGRYRLEVPLDNNGNVTLQAFVAGFQPFRKTIATKQFATGVWTGTSTETGFGTSGLTGLLINNELYFISPGVGSVDAGSYRVNGSSISGNTSLYEINGGLFGTANFTGTITTGTTLNGRFNTSYGSEGTISLTYDPITDRGSSLSKANGIWSLTDGSYTLTLSIDKNGRINGSDSYGCVYNGSGSIIDSSKNIYRVRQTISSCGSFNDTYSGYGVVSDDASINDTFIYVVNNPNYLLYGALRRQ